MLALVQNVVMLMKRSRWRTPERTVSGGGWNIPFTKIFPESTSVCVVVIVKM